MRETPAVELPAPVVQREQPLVIYVLPVYDEVDGVDAFHAALVEATARRPDLRVEFVYVDDGSSDGSLDRLLELRAGDPRVTVLGLSRNFGHQLAVTAGLDLAHEARPDAVIVMDTDLQDPPAVSLELIEVWESGADVVYAQRRSRRDTLFKRTTASSFYWLLDRLAETHIPRDVGDFRLIDRRVLDVLVTYREHNRFLRGLVANLGFRQEGVLFDRDARVAGESKYPLRRMLRLAADGILGFSTFPLRLISRLGGAISALSLLAALYAVVVRVLFPAHAVPGWAFLGVGMFFLGGIQLIMMGVIGSYVGRTYVQSLNRPLYNVALVARGQETPAE
ncbi:MAG: glycosyltransferase family 2 protein [Nocardioides sp.]|uniref:glycosyltransferase family 2 protein n=1 Tax=Nocardioides sp. TaxID=35761 RepID=UPI0039E35E56